jgi:hypothetical protein
MNYSPTGTPTEGVWNAFVGRKSPVLCAGGVLLPCKMTGVILFYTGKSTQNRALPTHHRTPDAPRWRSRLALGVGEGQKLTRCIDSPVRRRGGAVSNEAKLGSFYTEKSTPPAHTQNRTPDALRWRSRLALDVGEGQKLTRCVDSPVRRRGGIK